MNTSHDTFDGPADLAHHADTAYEAVRQINHLTVARPVLPAPDLYPVLGSLTLLGHALHQALGQLIVGLAASPDYYDLREDNPNRDPLTSIEEAADWLTSAAEHAATLGYTLGKAQVAIAGQGWHSNTDLDDEDDDQAVDEQAVDEQDGADR